MTTDYEEILRRYWGYPAFRGIQRDIIESIAGGHDTLGLMPTGGGKSVTFQVPALAMEGVCLVITPLIALMKDQVSHLRQRRICAAAIYSGMSRQEIVTTLENAIFGGVKILYVSPERLQSPIFLTKLQHIHVSFVTVDEAHCISQWGYDFRPSYLKIREIRQLLPSRTPILALTATATPRVAEDIQLQLDFVDGRVYSMSFYRPNLAYIVRRAPDKEQEMLHILRSVAGSAIVYVRSRKRTREIAQALTAEGLTATFFHAGLDPTVKDQRQEAWQNDEQRVIVATNAFGMGIDKPDVRLVIHYDSPDSIEAYFQEAGRAGRDGQKAYAVMLYNASDTRKLHRRLADNFPEKEYIADVYEHLAYYYQIGVGSGADHTFSFEIEKFCSIYHYFPTSVDAALRLLENSGYLHYETDPDSSARLMFLLGREQLYRLHEVSPMEETVITALLRSYGGLFTDYCCIQEGLIAKESGLTGGQVYNLLKGLSARRILHFIPRRKTPFVTYTRSRVDGSKVTIPASVYEERKTQFAERIDAMIAYAETDGVCRSRMLLDYFGERRADDCGHCDVCVERKRSRQAESHSQQAQAAILELLADGLPHPVSRLHTLLVPRKYLDDALASLVAEQVVCMQDGMLTRTE